MKFSDIFEADVTDLKSRRAEKDMQRRMEQDAQLRRLIESTKLSITENLSAMIQVTGNRREAEALMQTILTQYAARMTGLSEDVVDLASKRKEKQFYNKVNQMTQPEPQDDLRVDSGRLLNKVQQQYGQQLREMNKFLARPVMTGGFKSSYELADALAEWKQHGQKTPEKIRRAIQLAATNDDYISQIKHYNALWHAITDKFPLEVIWVLPQIDDFEVLETLSDNLAEARQYFHGK